MRKGDGSPIFRFWTKRGQNGPKIGFLQIWRKSSPLMCTFLLLKMKEHNVWVFCENRMSGKNLVLELSDLTGYGTATDRFATGYRWFNVRRLSSFLQKFSIFFSDFFAKRLSIISTIDGCLVPYCDISRLAQIIPKLGQTGHRLQNENTTFT